MLAGLFRLKGFTTGDKLRALNIGKAIRASSNGVMRQWNYGDRMARPVSGSRNGLKSASGIRWPLLRLMKARVASARMMSVVLKEAFSGNRANARIGISRVGLSDLYTVAAKEFIQSRGGR